jgi:uncharacterized protein (TIGR02217 family)
MSNLIYPKLRGETWPIVKRPVFSTVVQTAATGRETRIANYPFARWEYEIPYSFLDAATGFEEFQQLVGFYCLHNGQAESFLFHDETDCLATGQAIGTGNGAKTQFQMQRTLGGSTQPVYGINGIDASYPAGNAPPIKVFVNGGEVAGWTLTNGGLLTFGGAPSGAITANFGYFWRVRFQDEKLEFENFAQNLWEARKVALITVRQ